MAYGVRLVFNLDPLGFSSGHHLNTIHFWNGNKSSSRQKFERALLSLCLEQSGTKLGPIAIDTTDYPKAEDEGNIFNHGCDVLVSVAGNQKFVDKPAIVIEQPVCRGLLGHRLLLIERSRAAEFSKISTVEQLRRLTVGIPATWADADLFRYNLFDVAEKGSLDDLFTRLLDQQFDFIALGANEIEAIYADNQAFVERVQIEPTLLLYYPLPLVFYVHPNKPQLAKAIEIGLKQAIANGTHRELFDEHHPQVVTRLDLTERNTFNLINPHLPESLRSFWPQL